MMRDTILRAVLGAAIGMGISMLLSFVKFAIAEKAYPSGGMIPLLPSGLTAAIILAILLGIIGGIIGLIVGAFGLRPYQGAAVGILFVALRWREVFDSVRSVVAKIQAGHYSSQLLFNDILVLSIVLDFIIVGALVSLFLRRFLTR